MAEPARLFPDRVYWTALRVFDPPLAVAVGSDFLNQLQFLPDKKRYNVYLQVALIRISSEDVELTLNW